jgi:hypothetical protein
VTLNKIAVVIEGCHEQTDFDMYLTDDQLAFMEQVAVASEMASGYECQPKIRLVKPGPSPRLLEGEEAEWAIMKHLTRGTGTDG